MKNRRQQKIKELIEQNSVETQSDLAQLLNMAGFEVTQATVSRDIKDMGLIKIPSANGGYKYAYPRLQTSENGMNRLLLLFRDSVVSYDYANNLIVVKCLPGTAQAVASCLDAIVLPGIIGTVAGDDTILLVSKETQFVPDVLAKFDELKG